MQSWLKPEDKAWLREQAQHKQLSEQEILHRAITQYRVRNAAATARMKKILEQTHGTWSKGDALEFQRALRDEWND